MAAEKKRHAIKKINPEIKNKTATNPVVVVVDNIAEKSLNQRNATILHGLNLGHQRAWISKKITTLV